MPSAESPTIPLMSWLITSAMVLTCLGWRRLPRLFRRSHAWLDEKISIPPSCYELAHMLFGWLVLVPLFMLGVLSFHRLQVLVFALPNEYVRSILGTVTLMAIAAALFKLKRSNLRRYAYFEGLFSIALAAVTFAQADDLVFASQLVPLLASVWVMIRAAENFFKDLEERRAAAATPQMPQHQTPVRAMQPKRQEAHMRLRSRTAKINRFQRVLDVVVMFVTLLVTAAILYESEVEKKPLSEVLEKWFPRNFEVATPSSGR